MGAHFQYEDIYSKANNYYEKESYYMRHLYNLYTSTDGTHYMPDGGMLIQYQNIRHQYLPCPDRLLEDMGREA